MKAPPLNFYGRLKWVLSGEVSDAVNDYDGAEDAIAFPVLAWGLFASVAYSSHAALTSGNLALELLGVLGLLLGVCLLLFGIILCAATVVYATENTEIPPEGRLNRGR